MEIKLSILSLAKNNNGFWKSEKQKDFLSSVLNSRDGFIGHSDSGYNSCPIFAEYDEKGILSIVKHAKNSKVIMFERKTENILTSLEIKEIKRLERLLNKVTKQLNKVVDAFKDGSYNGTNDISTYSDDMILSYENRNKDTKDQIEKIKSKINKLKN